MDEQGLHIAITASSRSASETVDGLEKRLEKLEQAFNKVGKGAETSGKDAEKATGFFGKLSNVFKDIEAHSRTAGMALGQLGLHTDAAAARVSGLGNLFKGLGSATPMLMGIGAALTAVGGAAEFLKSSADKASQFQQSMDILGRTVKDSGADWASARRQVLAFAQAQERTTTYSRDDVVNALRQMTSAGMSYKDSMAEIRVAEDASAATGQNLMTVSHGLVEALHGRTQALTMLGIGTKQSIHQGMTLYQMNAAIEKQMGGSAQSAAKGYAGSMTRLHNAFETLQEKIGTAVLPILTKLAQTLTSMVETAEKDFSKWEAAAHAFYLRNKQAFDALGKAISAVWNNVKTQTQVAWAEITGIVKLVLGGIADEFTFFSDLFTGHTNRLWDDVKKIFVDAWHNLTSGFGNFGDNLITIAERIAKAVAHAFEAPFAAMSDAMHGNFAKAKSELAGTFSGFGNLTSGLTWSFGSGGGGPTHEEAASNPLLALSAAAGNTMAGGPMNGAHHRVGHSARSKAAAAARKAEAAAIREARKELQEYIATLDLEQKKHHLTIAQEISDLKHYESTHKLTSGEHIKIEQKIEALEQQSARLTQQAERKKQAAIKATVRAVEQHEKALKKAAAAEQRELQKQQAAWQKYYRTLEQNAQQWTNKTAGWIESMFRHGKKGANSFAEAFKAMLKQIEEALLKSMLFKMFMGAQGGQSSSFMSIFAQNMGFGSKSASAPAPSGGMGFMSVATSALSMFGGKGGGALSHIASMFGGKGAASGSGGIIGALIGTPAASQLAASLPTDSLMSMLFGVGAPSVPGLGGASGGGLSGLAGFLPVIAGSNGPGGGTLGGALGGGLGSIVGGNFLSKLGGNLFKGGIPQLMNLLDFGHGSILMGTSGSLMLGAGLLGVGAGSLFANLLFGSGNGSTHGTWGSILGGLGGLFGGPVGGLVGGLIGSLFGHKDNPATMPDKYDTQNYGTIVSDLLGGGEHGAAYQTVNGQHFYAQSSLMSASGGKSGIAWIEETLAQYANPDGTMKSNAPDWLKPLWGQLVSNFGISASGSGQLNFNGHNIGQEWITGAQGVTYNSGNMDNYQQLGNLLDSFYQAFVTQGQTSVTSPNQPPTGNTGGFNVTSPFAGAYVVGTPGSSPQLVGSGLPTFALNPDPGAGTGPGAIATPGEHRVHLPSGMGNDMVHSKPYPYGSVHVTVNIGGSVTTEHDLVETIRQKILDEVLNNPNATGMALHGYGPIG